MFEIIVRLLLNAFADGKVTISEVIDILRYIFDVKES